MPFSVVQAAPTITIASNTATVTLPQPTGTGNTLVACISGDNSISNPSVTGVTLGGSADHWTAAVTDPGTTVFGATIWYDPGCASGQTSVVVSATSTGAGPELYVAVYEVSGALVFDQGSHGDAGVATTWSSGTTPTTTHGSEIFFALCGASAAIPTVTGAGTWTTQFNGFGTFDQISGFQIVSALGTATFSGTIPSGRYTAIVATFGAAPFTRTFAATVTTAGSLGRGLSRVFQSLVSAAGSLIASVIHPPAPVQVTVTITPVNQAVMTITPANQAVVTIASLGGPGAVFHPAEATGFHPPPPAAMQTQR